MSMSISRKYHNTRLSLRRRWVTGELASVISMFDPRDRDVKRIVVEIQGKKPTATEMQTAMNILDEHFGVIILFQDVRSGLEAFIDIAKQDAASMSPQEFLDWRAGSRPSLAQ